LNAWSQCDRAIVTELPGTTRDVVESQLVVGGIPVQCWTQLEFEKQLILWRLSRAIAVAPKAADLVLTIDASDGWTVDDQNLRTGAAPL